jgi:hypothetical protein
MTQPFRNLSLDGGGIMGAFADCALATIEKATVMAMAFKAVREGPQPRFPEQAMHRESSWICIPNESGVDSRGGFAVTRTRGFRHPQSHHSCRV